MTKALVVRDFIQYLGQVTGPRSISDQGVGGPRLNPVSGSSDRPPIRDQGVCGCHFIQHMGQVTGHLYVTKALVARDFIQYLGQVTGHLYVTKALVVRDFIQYLVQVTGHLYVTKALVAATLSSIWVK